MAGRRARTRFIFKVYAQLIIHRFVFNAGRSGSNYQKITDALLCLVAHFALKIDAVFDLVAYYCFV